MLTGALLVLQAFTHFILTTRSCTYYFAHLIVEETEALRAQVNRFEPRHRGPRDGQGLSFHTAQGQQSTRACRGPAIHPFIAGSKGPRLALPPALTLVFSPSALLPNFPADLVTTWATFSSTISSPGKLVPPTRPDPRYWLTRPPLFHLPIASVAPRYLLVYLPNKCFSLPSSGTFCPRW